MADEKDKTKYEVEDGEVEDKENSGGEKEEKTLSVEDLAKQLGWNPNYDGDDRQFVSAADFILRSKEIQNTMTKTLKSQKREMDELKSGLVDLKNHNETVFRVQVARLRKEISDLKARRKEAKEDGDDDTVRELDAQIKDLNEMPSELPKSAGRPHPDFVKWLDKNEWYSDNEEMRSYADAQAEDVKFKGLPPSKVLPAITKRVKEMFPDEFPKEAEKRPKAAVGVEAPTPSKSNKTRFTKKDLNEDQRKSADFFAKQGIMTVDEYIKELAEIGELA